MAEPGSKFHVAVVLTDPLSAERVVEILQEGGIDAFARARGAASSASFEPVDRASWEIFVPEGQMEKAERMIKEELDAIEKDAEENAKAAEEESLSGETKTE
jgi:hypothetical protein